MSLIIILIIIMIMSDAILIIPEKIDKLVFS